MSLDSKVIHTVEAFLKCFAFLDPGRGFALTRGIARMFAMSVQKNPGSHHRKGFPFDDGYCLSKIWPSRSKKFLGALVTGRGFALTRGTAFPMCGCTGSSHNRKGVRTDEVYCFTEIQTSWG